MVIYVKSSDRRAGNRMNTHFHITTFIDGRPFPCHGVDLSTTGALVRRRSGRRAPLVQHVELDIGDRLIRGAARTVWSNGELQALRFVGLTDVDRLEIAEHLDRAARAA